MVHAFDRGAKLGLLSAAHKAVATIQTQIIPTRSPSPVDRGIYRLGWRARQETFGASFGNAEPHAAFVEVITESTSKPPRALAVVGERTVDLATTGAWASGI